MMRLLTLREYQSAPAIPLSATERDDIRRLAPSVDITPSIGAEGSYDLRPGSEVRANVASKRFILNDGAGFAGRVEPQHVEAALRVARFQKRKA